MTPEKIIAEYLSLVQIAGERLAKAKSSWGGFFVSAKGEVSLLIEGDEAILSWVDDDYDSPGLEERRFPLAILKMGNKEFEEFDAITSVREEREAEIERVENTKLRADEQTGEDWLKYKALEAKFATAGPPSEEAQAAYKERARRERARWSSIEDMHRITMEQFSRMRDAARGVQNVSQSDSEQGENT